MSARRAIFRADAAPAIGTGHIVRCLTLARALLREGWTAGLASRELPVGLREMAVDAGVEIIAIPATASVSDEIGLITEDPRSLDLVVADHYGIDAAWFDALAGRAALSMAIDDLADRDQPVDIVLNQNLGIPADAYDRLIPSDATLLSGPRYALVGEAFPARREHMRVRSGTVDRILVFLGGADIEDVTSRAWQAIVDMDVVIDVVVGSAYRHLGALRQQLASRRAAALHVNIDRMDALMDAADLAVGAPGSASWERCTLGLPSVLITLADNQRPIERGLVDAGAAISVGWHDHVTPDMIRAEVDRLRAQPARVTAMSRAAAAVTDGHGTSRVVREIERRSAERVGTI
jgi:UDP-2,4-diacetamido-2,4,6-trideoxy-beta-L-altropyranose hydrolase